MDKQQKYTLLVISVITFAVSGLVLLSSDVLTVKIVGFLIVMLAQIMIILTIYAIKQHKLPNNVYRREKIIKKFIERNDMALTDKTIRTITEASYYSSDWEELITEMTYRYVNIYDWLKNGSRLWLNLYLVCFPQQEISPDMGDQYRTVMDKHFMNLARIIIDNQTRFDSDEDVVKYLNTEYYMKFTNNTFALWKNMMRQKGIIVSVKSKEKFKTETEIQKLIRNYDEKVSQAI